MPFFDVSTSGQDTLGQLKVFLRSFTGTLVLRVYERSLTRRTRIACAFHAVCFGNYTFFQWQGRLPPAATKPVRSSTSFTVESLLRSAAVKLLARGNKSDTGTDGCHFEACNSSASSQCWPRCAPQGLLLLWGALEGLGRLYSLEGKPFHRPLSSQQCADLTGTPWTQVRRAGQRLQSRYSVYLGTAPRHIWVQSLSGSACCAMGVGLWLRPPSCVRYCPVTDGSGNARSDGSRALTMNHPYGPSLVVRSYLVWDVTRRELWETALLSTKHRSCEPSCHMRSRGRRPC